MGFFVGSSYIHLLHCLTLYRTAICLATGIVSSISGCRRPSLSFSLQAQNSQVTFSSAYLNRDIKMMINCKTFLWIYFEKMKHEKCFFSKELVQSGVGNAAHDSLADGGSSITPRGAPIPRQITRDNRR